MSWLKSFKQDRAEKLAGKGMTPEEVHQTGRHDSSYYQAKVEQAVIDSGGSEYKAWQAGGDALHLSPQEISRMYGEAAGKAALELQKHNGSR